MSPLLESGSSKSSRIGDTDAEVDSGQLDSKRVRWSSDAVDKYGGER